VDTITLSFKISPHSAEADLYPMVDAVIALIASKGIKHVVGASETTMEGDWDTLFAVVKEAHQLCLQNGAWRVGSVLQVDMAPRSVSIDEKLGKYR